MTNAIDLGRIYGPSEDVVVREIEGEIVIVPLASGIGDLEDELFALNETGRAIWSKLDGRRPLGEVVRELSAEYDAPENVIREDAVGLLQELLNRRIIVEKG
jgi:Coenzyme PQQ synthesis protein D (PqqD)